MSFPGPMADKRNRALAIVRIPALLCLGACICRSIAVRGRHAHSPGCARIRTVQVCEGPTIRLGLFEPKFHVSQNGHGNRIETHTHTAKDKVMALIFLSLEPTWPQVQYHVTRGDILRESLTPVANRNTRTTTEYPTSRYIQIWFDPFLAYLPVIGIMLERKCQTETKVV